MRMWLMMIMTMKRMMMMQAGKSQGKAKVL